MCLVPQDAGGHRFFFVCNCAEFWDPEATLPRVLGCRQESASGISCAEYLLSMPHERKRGSTRPANHIGCQGQSYRPACLNREEALPRAGYNRHLMISEIVLMAALTFTAVPYRRRLMLISVLRNIKLRGLSRPIPDDPSIIGFEIFSIAF